MVEFFKNAAISRLKPGEATPATAGHGLEFKAVPRRPGVGTDTSAGVDVPAVYVKLLKKGTNESLGTFLLAPTQRLVRLGGCDR